MRRDGSGRATFGSRLVAVTVAAGALLACGAGPTDVSGSCIAVVNVEGSFLGSFGDVVAEAWVGNAYLQVSRSTGCLDQGQAADPLASGESNFLPVGTELHRITGFEPTERLTYRSETGEWRLLSTIAPGDSTEITLAVGDDVAVPGTAIRLALTAISSDSRCARDVVCVWAGDVEAEIGVAIGTGPTTALSIHLNSGAGADTVAVGGYLVRLVGVAPVAYSSRTIAPEEYRLRFRVTAGDAGG